MKVKELFEEELKILEKSISIETFECHTGEFPNYIKLGETHLKGDFSAYHCSDLLSLKRAPKEITGDFDINGCKKLKSLDFGPIKITGDYSCCECNTLESLEGSPREVIGEFWCRDCDSLDTLEGAPDRVTSDVNIGGECNNLRGLSGIGVKYFKEIGGELTLPGNIRYNILGLLKIKDLKSVNSPDAFIDFHKALKIINRHLESKNPRKCKSELEEAGLGEFAKL